MTLILFTGTLHAEKEKKNAKLTAGREAPDFFAADIYGNKLALHA